MKKLPDKWKYQDLLIREANTGDIEALKDICNSWDDKEELEGEPFSEDYIKNCIEKGDLPPVEDADRDNFSTKVIVDDKGESIGFFVIYHGYPRKDCLWIGMFVIGKKQQKQQYGQKAVSSILELARENGFKCCGLGVYLKNWSALRFWSRNGFTRIGAVAGDKEFSADTFALISLFHDI